MVERHLSPTVSIFIYDIVRVLWMMRQTARLERHNRPIFLKGQDPFLPQRYNPSLPIMIWFAFSMTIG